MLSYVKVILKTKVVFQYWVIQSTIELRFSSRNLSAFYALITVFSSANQNKQPILINYLLNNLFLSSLLDYDFGSFHSMRVPEIYINILNLNAYILSKIIFPLVPLGWCDMLSYSQCPQHSLFLSLVCSFSVFFPSEM